MNKEERTIEEKLEGISFLESLGLSSETINAIEEGIYHSERKITLADWKQLGI